MASIYRTGCPAAVRPCHRHDRCRRTCLRRRSTDRPAAAEIPSVDRGAPATARHGVLNVANLPPLPCHPRDRRRDRGVLADRRLRRRAHRAAPEQALPEACRPGRSAAGDDDGRDRHGSRHGRRAGRGLRMQQRAATPMAWQRAGRSLRFGLRHALCHGMRRPCVSGQAMPSVAPPRLCPGALHDAAAVLPAVPHVVHGGLPAVAAGAEPATVPPVWRGHRRGILI